MQTFYEALKVYTDIQIDPENFDPSVAARKFDAYYNLHNAIQSGLPIERPTTRELNYFSQYIEGSAGQPRFVMFLKSEQQELMYQQLKAQEQ